MNWRKVRMTLRRYDTKIYLDRWGFEHPRVGGLFLHRMDAPDPGLDLHDHPWSFLSIVLTGGYIEERADTRNAPKIAAFDRAQRGIIVGRRRGSARVMRLDECHRITRLDAPRVWTLVLHGPRRRSWGFYLADGYMGEQEYDETVRVERRDLVADHGYVESLLKASSLSECPDAR